MSRTLLNELDRIAPTRFERYFNEIFKTLSSNDPVLTKLREMFISKNLNCSMEVDLCFVLDCTGSMKNHIAAAKDCILQVVEVGTYKTCKHQTMGRLLWLP